MWGDILKKIKKIHIEGEGKQILHLLQNKYSLTKEEVLKQYATKTNLYEKTLKQYLKNKKIQNEKFIKFLEVDFAKSFDELIKTVTSQVIFYVENINEHIHLYNEEHDIINITFLIQLCQQFNMRYHQLIAMGNLARCKANMGLSNTAKELINDVIEKAKVLNYMDLVVFYYTNLAYIENNEENYATSRKALKQAEIIINTNTIDNKDVLYKFWYTYGITLTLMGKQGASKRKFLQALRNADNLLSEVKCIFSIALNYKLEGKYSKAISLNVKTLTRCGNNLEIKSAVLNNIANVYYAQGNAEMAKKYINDAIALMPKEMNVNFKTEVYDSYLTIESDYQKVKDELLQLFTEFGKITEAKKSLYNCIDTLILKLISKENYKALIHFCTYLMDMVSKEVNERDIEQLKTKIGDIMIFFIKKGVLIYEKETNFDGINYSKLKLSSNFNSICN